MAEQMLAELQEVLARLGEAREEYESHSDAKPGDEPYDDIFHSDEVQACEDPHATCLEQLAELVRVLLRSPCATRMLTRVIVPAGSSLG